MKRDASLVVDREAVRRNKRKMGRASQRDCGIAEAEAVTHLGVQSMSQKPPHPPCLFVGGRGHGRI